VSSEDNHTITAPKGFLASGVHCGLKSSDDPDLGVIFCQRPASAAGVFTTNAVEAAPVTVCRQRVASGKARAVVVNAGNANACTGRQGLDDALAMTQEAADRLGIDAASVLPASTGVIGRLLDMDKVRRGIEQACETLADGKEAGMKFSRSILTTDTRVKTAFRQFESDGRVIRVAGTAKGAGMICPHMATMLAFITTDMRVSPAVLRQYLIEAVGQTFNRITVDGQTSTNDCVLVLASGLAENRYVDQPWASELGKYLYEICEELALAIVADGEGATKLIHVEVIGAKSLDQAQTVARAVADSLLVKTAIHGQDANWGRIVSAAGACGAHVDPSKLACRLEGIEVFKGGVGAAADAEKLRAALAGEEITITLDLGQGHARTVVHTCDLSQQYVRINAFYHT